MHMGKRDWFRYDRGYGRSGAEQVPGQLSLIMLPCPMLSDNQNRTVNGASVFTDALPTNGTSLRAGSLTINCIRTTSAG
jgi:hypothetical protein